MASLFTPNKNLYKWQTTDLKQTTITEMGNNMDKLDTELAETMNYLIDVGVNVKANGAKGDGITDDAPIIRKCIAALKQRGGGRLFFPKPDVSYYVASGDPRGLNGSGIFSKNDFYTCFELIPNLTIEGDHAKIRYESNRLGYNLATGKGDAGCMLGNFRVTSSTDTPFLVDGNVTIKNIDIEYTPLAVGEKDIRDYIDGQFIRVNQVTNEKHGNFIFENINVYNPPGHQVFNVYDAESIIKRNVNYYEAGKPSNIAITDFSGCFLSADVVRVEDCKYHPSKTSIKNTISTAFELHGKKCFVDNNVVENMGNFINIAGTKDTSIGADYFITNNIAKDVGSFSALWVYATKKINSVVMDNNKFLARIDNDLSTEHIIRFANDNGDLDSTILTVGKVSIRNMEYDTIDPDIAPISSQSTGMESLIFLKFVEDIDISHNKFNHVRRGLFRFENNRMKRIRLKDNKGLNLAYKQDSTDDSSPYRSAIYYLDIPSAEVLEEYIVEDNHFELKYPATTYDSYGILFANWSGRSVSDKNFSIKRNKLIGATKEIDIKSTVANGQYLNSFDVDHVYTTSISDALLNTLFLANEGETEMYKESSKVTAKTSLGDVVIKKTKDSYLFQAIRNAIPTDGYWTQGSRLKNPNPMASGYEGFVCVTTGSPGTWKGSGLIQS